MKTQINRLVSGKKALFLNKEKDYSGIKKQPDGGSFVGSPQKECDEIWEAVKKENPKFLLIKIKDEEIRLSANWSQSKKSCSYAGYIPIRMLWHFQVSATKEPKKIKPFISIDLANHVLISNGKNGMTYICPSFIEII